MARALGGVEQGDDAELPGLFAKLGGGVESWCFTAARAGDISNATTPIAGGIAFKFDFTFEPFVKAVLSLKRFG